MTTLLAILWVLVGMETFIITLRYGDRTEMHAYDTEDWRAFRVLAVLGPIGTGLVVIILFMDFMKENIVPVFSRVLKVLTKPL